MNEKRDELHNRTQEHEHEQVREAPVSAGQQGFARDPHDADWATEAQVANNADYVVELIDGRCSIDGLPEGNCSHFPGPQELMYGPNDVLEGDDAAEKDRPAGLHREQGPQPGGSRGLGVEKDRGSRPRP